MEKVQNSSNSVCYTPSLEPFRTNRYMLSKKFQEVSILSRFTLGLGSGKMLQCTKCMWFWLSICSWTLYKSLHLHHITRRISCYSLHFFFSEIFSLERLKVIIKCMYFSDNNKQNQFRRPPKLSKKSSSHSAHK
jgi:hypothetical protein